MSIASPQLATRVKLFSIRGGNIKDLENKRYTIGVGISLGNKWFNVENIVGQIEWALHYSKDKVVVYVADSIHAINLEVRNKIAHGKALNKANEQGNEILSAVKKAAEEYFEEKEIERITYAKWNDLVAEKYNQKVEYLRYLYDHNNEFQNCITTIVRNFIQKEKRAFSDKEIFRLGEYIIEELPEVINRIKMKGVQYDAYTYPFDGELTKLVEEIQEGKRFQEIRKNIMDTKPKVFLEVR